MPEHVSDENHPVSSYDWRDIVISEFINIIINIEIQKMQNQELPISQSTQPPTHPRSSSCQTPNQQLICDFSSVFKRKGSYSNKPKISTSKAGQQPKSPNWLLQIPTKLQFTLQDMRKRRVMDERRWMSITKTKLQDIQSEGLKIVAAIASCWNYLANQQNNLMSVSNLLQIIKGDVDLSEIKSLSQWKRYQLIQLIIQSMNKQVNPRLKSKIQHKYSNPCRNEEPYATMLQNLRKNQNIAYIYLGYKDIYCPIGFDITPLKQIQAYQKLQNIKQEDTELWIINSSLGASEPSFYIKRWSDVETDLKTQWPYFIDIKEAKLGVRVRPEMEVGAKDQEKKEEMDKQKETINKEKVVEENGNGKQNHGGSNCIVMISVLSKQ